MPDFTGAHRRFREALAAIRARERAAIDRAFDRYDSGDASRDDVIRAIDRENGEAFTEGLRAWDECGRPMLPEGKEW